jgi:hypothetical protein
MEEEKKKRGVVYAGVEGKKRPGAEKRKGTEATPGQQWPVVRRGGLRWFMALGGRYRHALGR